MLAATQNHQEPANAICPTLLPLGTGVKQILNISIEDVAITKDIVAAGKLLNIDVLDHLVIGRQCFVSLKERGLGFA